MVVKKKKTYRKNYKLKSRTKKRKKKSKTIQKGGMYYDPIYSNRLIQYQPSDKKIITLIPIFGIQFFQNLFNEKINTRDDEHNYYLKFSPNMLQKNRIINEKNLAELNETYLLCYPSTGGYHILDSSFTGPDCPIELFSESSKGLLGYFYDIHLR